MAPRQRFIHPVLWQSERFNELTFRQRLLFIGLFSLADDEGRIKASAKAVKLSVFPGDDIPLDEIEKDLTEIYRRKMIALYEADGAGRIAYVENWKVYQHPKYAKPSLLPPLAEGFPMLAESMEQSLPTDRDGMDRIGLGREGSDVPQASPAEKKEDPEFKKFWAKYPRKKNISEARQAWNGRIKDGFTPAQIMNGLEGYLAELVFNRTEPNFIKYPATMINGFTEWTDWKPPETSLTGLGRVTPANEFKGGDRKFYGNDTPKV